MSTTSVITKLWLKCIKKYSSFWNIHICRSTVHWDDFRSIQGLYGGSDPHWWLLSENGNGNLREAAFNCIVKILLNYFSDMQQHPKRQMQTCTNSFSSCPIKCPILSCVWWEHWRNIWWCSLEKHGSMPRGS